MYDARAIANWFIDKAEKSGETLTAMKLQKLTYVSHGWYLAFAGKPLVHDAVEAWKWGPVFRSLYREFRDFGSQPITQRATALDGSTLEERLITIEDYPDHEQMDRFLEGVWQAYGRYSAIDLSTITHQEGTPWRQMFEQMGNRILPYTVIPNEMIAEHYQRLRNERSSSANTAS